MNKKFENSLLSAVFFFAAYVGLFAAGFVTVAVLFGILTAIMFTVSIVHVCSDVFQGR